MIFSYWIFFWYLLYIFKFIKYNPKFILIFGLFENIILFCLMIYFGSKFTSIILFLIINFFIKIYPIYTLRNSKIKSKDIYASILLFIIYLFYLYVNNKSFIQTQIHIATSLLYDKNDTPFLHFVHLLKNYYEKL